MDKNTIINSHVNSHIDSLSVIHTNADNLINKLTELKLVISSMQIKPQVIAITLLLSVLELLNSLLITTLAEEVMCLCVLLITVKLLIK